MEVTRLSTRGQVVLPKPVRDRLGLVTGQSLAVEVEGQRVVLRPLLSEAGVDREREAQVDWRLLRGCLRGTNALDDLMHEHRREIERAR